MPSLRRAVGGRISLVKTTLLIAGAFVLLAAAPTKYGSFSAPLFGGVTVEPESQPQSQQLAVGGFTPAPLPNADASAPVLRSLGPPQATFSPNLFRAGKQVRGDGYVPGSTVEGNEQKRFSPTPGINMSVPLQ